LIKQFFTTIITAAAGTSGKEAAFGGIIAAVGTGLAAALGGWDIALQILLYCMLFDYVTGFLAAWKTKTIDSDVMLWGGIRKFVVLGIIALCVMMDEYFGNQSPVLETIAFYFYLGREVLSMVENLGKLNILVPDGIKDRLQQLKGVENDKTN
jgi:toxin secretion/phage lysis holin